MPGDSGSVVLNSDTRQVYGHIVVGSTVSRTAYIIPASNILNDLTRREEIITRNVVELATSTPQTEDSKEEATPNTSELQLPPDSIDLPPASSYVSQGLGYPDDTSLCTYDPSLCSEVESLFFSDDDSIASSNSSVGGFFSSAISEIVDLFLHSELQELYPAAISKLGPEKFQRNFRRLLLRYGRQLLQEASYNLEREVAVLVRRSATQITVQIRESIAQNENTLKGSSNVAGLNEWLKTVKSLEDEKDDDDLSGSSGSEDWEPDNASLSTFEGVKSFMVTGRAFSDLCETFQMWLKVGEDRKEIAPNITSENTHDDPPPTPSQAPQAPPKDSDDRFICTYPACDKNLTFKRFSDWQTHMDQHTRPYQCKVPGCKRNAGFATKGVLNRHIRIVHGGVVSASSSVLPDGSQARDIASNVSENIEASDYIAGHGTSDVPSALMNYETKTLQTYNKPKHTPPVSDDEDNAIDQPERPDKGKQPRDVSKSMFSKAVHFDTTLEQVRHLLQIDRPLAVEEAGSSPFEGFESDGDFPFPDPFPDDEFLWEIVVSNFPDETPERLQLPVRVQRVGRGSDAKNLVGSVVVANLGYDKHVVARFTLDYWKTTSEVVAEYNTDVRLSKYNEHDRFKFKIKVADQYNLEAKTMFFCVKYNVNGQEYWDNNNGNNFQVDFRKKRKPQSKEPQDSKSECGGLSPKVEKSRVFCKSGIGWRSRKASN
ncbi:uncharacterized protein LY89DRAFT_93794 [Mollisia scopiformis]|uniref:CBM21 domain-containing protein n=1 Tax=Mollisia scopiformis TaxID=149040 RepID=A0A194X6B0_MOLSC|nr:uncharacterized protein LY89DRAFT_93794 [Mollisia scopiformis]KUJ15716.1 hypothetical protein LY89DRAFT_93794 [Mollisia scopiformis]